MVTTTPNRTAIQGDRAGAGSPAPKHRQRGVAAVEFAIILPLLIALLTFPIFFARVFMHYSVAQKAAHDAAIYLSNIPMAEMNDYERSLDAADVAAAIAIEELAELRPGKGRKVLIQVDCDGGPCGNSAPDEVTIHVRMRMYDELFNHWTWEAIGVGGIPLSVQTTAKYVGN